MDPSKTPKCAHISGFRIKFKNRLGAPENIHMRGLVPKNEPIWPWCLGCRGMLRILLIFTLFFAQFCTLYIQCIPRQGQLTGLKNLKCKAFRREESRQLMPFYLATPRYLSDIGSVEVVGIISELHCIAYRLRRQRINFNRVRKRSAAGRTSFKVLVGEFLGLVFSRVRRLILNFDSR